MRVIIKKADFSSVSIGKIVRDLSFSFKATDGVDAINAFFPNYNSGGEKGETTLYMGTEGGTVTGSQSNGRLVSDFHEVSEGMTITCLSVIGGSTSVPMIVAFDSSKNVVSSSCVWGGSYSEDTNYIVPSNVKYLKFQTNAVLTGSTGYTRVQGSMPE